jgi:streptomycin 6-kinase
MEPRDVALRNLTTDSSWSKGGPPTADEVAGSLTRSPRIGRSSHEPMTSIPDSLRWLRRSAAGAAWLDGLPGLVDECVNRWSLVPGPPYPYAYASLALPAHLPDGTNVVLKIQFPDRESELEALALARWGGEGATRLLAHDPARRALMLERCVPGTPLSDLGQEAALDVMVGLLPRLWKPAGPTFRSLADEAAWWSEELDGKWDRAGRPFERRLVDAAKGALDAVPGSQGEQVLLHQDLHTGNVLRAEREPWLVIDPKPLVGEREFGIAALVRGGELGVGRDQVLHRLDRLTAELGLDRERARLWALAQTLAWAFEGDMLIPRHLDVCRWLIAAV